MTFTEHELRLLFEESELLYEAMFSGKMMIGKHPFTDSGIVAYRNNSGDIVQADITADTQALKEWRHHIIELINESRSVSDITAMVTKSYKAL